MDFFKKIADAKKKHETCWRNKEIIDLSPKKKDNKKNTTLKINYLLQNANYDRISLNNFVFQKCNFNEKWHLLIKF